MNVMASLLEDINLLGEVNNEAFLSHHGSRTTDSSFDFWHYYYTFIDMQFAVFVCKLLLFRSLY